MQQVAKWLKSLGLDQYAQRFAENCIDASVLRDLTEQDLEKIGIPLGHRKKMLRAIAELGGVVLSTSQAATEPSRQDIAERRQLTVMFCDLVGSTALSVRLDPEDMRTVIDVYLDGIIRSYDGFIAELRGDGILAYFGYPRAHEEDAERAVRAGIDIIAALAPRGGTAHGAHWHRDRVSGGRRPERRGWRARACGRWGYAEPRGSAPSAGRAGDDRYRPLHAAAARKCVPIARARPASAQRHCRAS